ncbi:MAG: hypothetical protein K6F48_12555 [Paludibacteraceae bacterium]|nr:hypothetical protein [Paludibacteraceae bacterium]
MKRFFRLTALVLFPLWCVLNSTYAEPFNSIITGQNVSMTEPNDETNLLTTGAIIDTSKTYQLKYELALDVNQINLGEYYELELPDIIMALENSNQNAVYILGENSKTVVGDIDNNVNSSSASIAINSMLNDNDTVHVILDNLKFVAPENYSGGTLTLNFLFGESSSSSFDVKLVGKPQLTGVSVENAYPVYDSWAHTINVSTEGDASGCTLSYAEGDGEFNLTEKPSYINAGEYIIRVKASQKGFADTIIDGIVHIGKREATVSANPVVTHEGQNPIELTYLTTGEVPGETLNGITISRTPGDSAGVYNINIRIEGEDPNPNYAVTTMDATYTITAHRFDTTVVEISQPTCTHTGAHKFQYKCSICEYTTYSEEITDAMLPHTWGRDTTTITEPKCEEKGVQSIKCLQCDATKTDSIDALGHDFNPIPTIDVEATCSMEGSQSKHCRRVGCEAKTDIESIVKKPHTWGRDTTTILAPTCIAGGKDSISCLLCDAFKIENIEALGHNFEDTFTVDVQPKCIEEGSKSKHCTRCEVKSEITSIPAIGHEFSEEYTIDLEPNCIENGFKSRHCIHEGCTVSIDTVELEANGGHVWEIDSVLVEATCTEDGLVNRRCTKCGTIRKNVTVQKLGHNFDVEFTIDIPATCKTKGEQSKHCTRCDARKAIEEIEALGHTWDEGTTTLAPTCTEKGLTTYSCVRGDTTKMDTIAALGHDFSEEFTIDEPNTCTENGEKSRHCSRCTERTEITVIEAPGHNWSDTTISIQPQCTTKGEKTITCGVCHTTKKEEIDSLGHSFSDNFTIDLEPTCENKGSKSKHCVHDGCTATIDVTEIAPIGHKMEMDTIQIEPSCTKTGQAQYKCTMCGEIETRVIMALGHEFADTFTIDRIPTCLTEGLKSKHCIRCVEKIEITTLPKGEHQLKAFEVIKEATCTEGGMTKFKCEVCGTVIDSTINKLGHDWENDYTIDLAPTCTMGGSKSKHCSRCNAKTGATFIPSPGHMPGSVKWENIVEPTCTEDGSHDENIYCERCGELQDSNHKIDLAKGHDYEGTEEYFVKPTCTESGIVLYTCKICKNIAKDTVSAMGHAFAEEYTVDVPATCLELGSESRHCTRTDCDAKFDKREISPLGHQWTESDTIEAPTCTKGGLITKICDRCHAKEDKITEALGHAFADTFTVDVEPTCQAGGQKSRHCIRCEERKDTVMMPATDHQPGEPIKEDYKPANCLEPGTYTEVIKCRFCDLELSRTSGVAEPATGHQWNEGTDVVAPTCTEGGIKTFTCTVCGAVDTKNVGALGHTYADTFTIDKPVTCLTDGLQSKHCIRCDIHGFEDTIRATGHLAAAKVIENDTAATCTKAGSCDTVEYCAVCKAELSRIHTVIEELGHRWNPEINTVEPTCVGKGIISHTCKVCHVTETREISALGHQYADTFTVDINATCDSEGNKSRHCVRCAAKSNITTIPALGHNYVSDTTLAPTCTKGGTITLSCTRCEKTKKETIAALGHQYADTFTVDIKATCTATGEKSKHCIRCDEKTEITEIESIAHVYVSDTTLAPTCTKEGTITSTCTMCKRTEKESIAALGHDFETTTTVDKPASCTEEGINSIHCKRCDVKKDTVKTPAIGHDFDNGAITKEPTETEEGVKTFTCTRCDTKNNIALKKLVSLEALANGQLFSVNEDGYCQGEDGHISYTIKDGVAIDYMLTFSDSAKTQGFSDKEWTSVPSDNQIDIQIPEGCLEGKYEANVVFRNEDSALSKPAKVIINVNLSQDYTIAIYRDVISVIKNDTRKFETFQWYHNGEKVEGATLPYYQEMGGLSGTYHVIINGGTDQELRTCTRSDWYNPLNKARDISVMPNPIRNGVNATIKLHNFTNTEHTLTVDNEFGTTIYGPTTFEGDELTIPVDNFGMVSGLFIITIDDVKAKVLKQ